MSVLFIGTHRLNRSPSQRFRFEQFLPFLDKAGIKYRVSSLLNEQDDATYYSKGNYLKKASVIYRSFLKRKEDIAHSSEYDVLFIQREAFLIGPPYFERLIKKAGKKLIFDFDDAIWLPNVSEVNKKFSWAKFASKTSEIISLSNGIIAGNQYLADYALQYNPNVHIIPTTIDTTYHLPKIVSKLPDRVCIGWTGSHTTLQYLELIIPVLKKIKQLFNNKVYFKIIGDAHYTHHELAIKGVKWNLDTEIDDLSEIDIGIMPLPNNQWTLGKCGFKGLQYMALEIPPVVSPVGVNTEIIEEGVNGFLASNEKEWIEKISLLIEDAELRKKIGKAARKTVEERFSVNSHRETFLSIIKNR
jgi:glycosyltransferase involved in cell wall biosynthesis